jgi:hypothetical protein
MKNRHFFSLIFLLIFLLYGITSASGQSQQDIFSKLQANKPGSGQVRIIQNANITSLVKKHLEFEGKKHGIPGYRILIFFGIGPEGRQKAFRIRSEMAAKYDGIKCKMKFDGVYYRVYFGSFRTQSEAIAFKKKVEKEYPDAYYVPDLIDFSELK